MGETDQTLRFAPDRPMRKPPFERLVVVYNEHTSHPRVVEQLRQTVVDAYVSRTTEVTTEPNPAHTREKVQEALPQDGMPTRIVVISGDGGVDDLLGEDAGSSPVSTYTPLVVLPGGNANDVYHTFWSADTHPLTAVNAQGVRDIHPVHARIRTLDGEKITMRTIHALSVGASALGAGHLATRFMRDRAGEPTWLHDMRVALHMQRHGRRFQATPNRFDETLPPTLLWDVMFPVIPRIARGNARFPHITGYETTTLHRYQAGGRVPFAIAGLLSKMGWLSHDEFGPSADGRVLPVQFSLGASPQRVWVQHGGEAQPVPAGSIITISREQTGVPVVTSPFPRPPVVTIGGTGIKV